MWLDFGGIDVETIRNGHFKYGLGQHVQQVQDLRLEDDKRADVVVSIEIALVIAFEVAGAWPSYSLVHETISSSIVATTILPNRLCLRRREIPFLALSRRVGVTVKVFL